MCRKAGWHVHTEQLVYIAHDETKRADLVVHTTDGRRLACDVMVTASPTPWTAHGEHLYGSAAAKASRYGATAGGLTYDRAKTLLLVHDAHNLWLCTEAVELLHEAVLAQATHNVPTAPTAWGSHLQATTADAAVDLMHAAVMSAWQMHAACGRMLQEGRA